MKKVLAAIIGWVTGIWNKSKATVKKAVEIGVTITDAIKNYDAANPGTLDIITAIIPGTIDDAIKAKLREYIPKVAIELRLVDATLGLTDPNEIMIQLIKVFQQIEGDYRITTLHNFSALLTKVAADGKIDLQDALVLVEAYFRNKNGKEPIALF